MKIKHYKTHIGQEIEVVQLHWYNRKKVIKWCIDKSSINSLLNTSSVFSALFYTKYTHNLKWMCDGSYLAVTEQGDSFVIYKRDLKEHFTKIK